jgi:hypothetical protein
MENESLELNQELSQENWVPVDKAYLGVLRVGFSVAHFIGLATASVFAWLLPEPANYFCFAIIALLLCSFLWLFFIDSVENHVLWTWSSVIGSACHD